MRRRFPLVRLGARVVLAHQGASHEAPPNTLPAFRAAVATGADALELDVHWTRDGVIVVSHDETVDRCSNGSGRICDMTLAELRRLDFGWNFSPDGGRTFPWRGRGVQIPTLREVLAAFPDMPLNIDVKPENPPSLAQFVRELHEADAFGRVVVASFHHRVLQRLRVMERRLWTSASPREAAAFLAQALVGRLQRSVPFAALQVPPRAGCVPVLTERVLKLAHRLGIPVHVWTVDEADAIEHWWRFGVDGIVSNEPRQARQIRDRLFGVSAAKEA